MTTVDLMEEMSQSAVKLQKGYETLQHIGKVEVGTTPKMLVWQQDKVKLYRYDRSTPAKCKIPVLVSFAIMNRHDVLDLQPDRSLMKKFLDEGLDVYIMDWGYPSKADRYLTMEDYIDGYMNNAVDFIREAHGINKINKMGICQGGTFSTIYAALYPEKLNTLTVYVAPFDFTTDKCMLYKWTKYIDVDTMVDSLGIIPADLLNAGFGMLKPSADISKYFGVMDMMQDESKIMNFLRMEYWKNDCPDLAGEMYRKYIKDLFRDNKLIKGEFELGGRRVDLKNITVPFLNVYATEDNIIPNESTIGINDKIGSKDKELYAFPGGHIGVFVGARSQKELGPKVAEWVTKRSK
ncbi:MAG: class III poly(R)-hydroxyalkanoic acid synthase subunit PhaC [Chitinophagaceae bacterium]|nr:class III poly(R)-hydroxyalkanoic acid synthase subunit PhaC [Chitinophagaceae bacterium]